MPDLHHSGLPILMARHNYGVRQFRAMPGGDIGVLRRNGEYRYCRWRGFLDRDIAARLVGAQSVRLKINSYALRDDIAPAWIDLRPSQHVHGCLIVESWPGEAFAILEAGRPRII